MIYVYRNNNNWSPIVDGLPDTMLIKNSHHALWKYKMRMNGSDLYLFQEYIYRYNTATSSVEEIKKIPERLDLR